MNVKRNVDGMSEAMLHASLFVKEKYEYILSFNRQQTISHNIFTQ